jgi:DNA-binding GntR family transcriptional regulator
MRDLTNLKEKSYDILKSKIIEGEFGPNFRLDERELGKLLGMSRTPIREAISKLELEDWVKVIPRKGVFVNEITLKDVNDIFQIRDNVEPFIVELAMENIENRKLEEFEEEVLKYINLKEMEKELDKIDHELHNYILESSKNKHLIKLIKNIYEHNIWIRNLFVQKKTRRLEAANEHLEIIQAMKDRDIDNAKKAVRKHKYNSKVGFLLNIGNLSV